MSLAQTRYLESQVSTMRGPAIVVALYRKLLVHLRAAQDAFARGDVERRTAALGKAQDIVLHLAETLDRDRGGAIAARLAELYGFFLAELHTAGVRGDAARLAPVAAMAAELLEAWTAAAAAEGTAGAAA